MAVTEEKDGALATAAVAAAAGVAAYGLRKALTSNGGGTSLVPGRNDGDDGDDEGREERAGGALTRGGSLLSTVWDSAAGSLLPVLEEAAETAGRWTAENAPDIVRDQIVPRFIEAFNDAA
jgi:hypothetical protein